MKKIFLGNIDNAVHSQFVRFGKGSFPGRAALSLVAGKKIKLSGSFEFANDFVEFVAENVDAKFSGIVMSREEILDFGKAKAKNGIYEYEVENISSEKIKEISDSAYFLLLDAESPFACLKMKKKLPKPGKSEGKTDDKFCILEIEEKLLPLVKESFFWDVPECKKAKVSHVYEIEDIIFPNGEKDFEVARLNSAGGCSGPTAYLRRCDRPDNRQAQQKCHRLR